MAKFVRYLADRITLERDLAPKSETAHGARLARMREVIKNNTSKIFTLNILTILFAMPLIAIFVIWMPIAEKNLVADMNFSAGLGIGYGAVDQTLEGINMIYSMRQRFILYFLTPSFMVFSIGIAGAMHVIRNYMWGVDVKLLRHFGRGIAKHWYKYLPFMTVGGLLATSAGYSLIEVLKQNALTGAAGAGYYVWVVLSFILCFFFVMFALMYMPMSVAYRFKAGALLKNCAIIGILMFIPSVFLSILLIGIPLIGLSTTIILYLIYGFFLLFGTSLYMLMITAFGQYACEGFINDVMDFKEEQDAKKAEQERKAVRQKSVNTKKSNVASYKKSRKDRQPEPVKTDEDKPAPFVSADAPQNSSEAKKPVNKYNSNYKRNKKR